MQILYGADASNINLTAQKRLIRVVYGQTQATPYAVYLDPSLRETSGTIRVPAAADEKGAVAGQGTVPLKRNSATKYGGATGAAFTYQGSLTPGLCLVKTTGENVGVHNGVAGIRTYGLLGQWVGGTFDGVKSQNEISAWLGPDSVYDLLAPAWNDTYLSAQITASTAGEPVYLYAGIDGRLCGSWALYEQIAQATKTEAEAKTGGKAIDEEVAKAKEAYNRVAEVVERPSSGVLRIKLLV